MYWELGVLNTGLPGESLESLILITLLLSEQTSLWSIFVSRVTCLSPASTSFRRHDGQWLPNLFLYWEGCSHLQASPLGWGRVPQLSQFSHSVVSHSFQHHGLQQSRPPCSLPAPWVYSNWCPLCRWCHPTISSFVVPFSSCPQSFPASGSFPMSQFFASCGQIGVSALASVLPMYTQDWSPLGWTGWITLQSKGLSSVFSDSTVQKHQYQTIIITKKKKKKRDKPQSQTNFQQRK